MTPSFIHHSGSLALCRPLLTLAAVLCVQTASAQLTLEFGNPVTLSPVSNFQFQFDETQTIALLVNNTGLPERLSGYTLELSIGGGGPPLGGTLGPAFTAVDLVTGTLFAADHGTPTVNGGPNPFPGLGAVPQYLGLSLTTISAAVPPEAVGAVTVPSGRSLLATLTVSASGFTEPETWSMNFVGAGASFFNDALNSILTPTLENSSISVVPEPRMSALAVGLALVGYICCRRKVGQP